MKLNIIYRTVLMLSVAVTLLFVSCRRELLNPSVKTSTVASAAFSTPAKIKAQVLSLYSVMKSGQFYGGRVIIYGDIKGEEFINEGSNLVTGADVWALNPTNSASSVLNLWSQAYYTINNCNIFIDGMTASGNSVVTADQAKNYIGEAKLVRALCYMNLLQFYARPYADGNGSKPGVPLRLKAIQGPGFSDLARSSVAEVFAQILKDLNEAETALPLSNANATENTTRAHRNTAIALKTRVYLAMQKYGDVITEANKIVSSNAPFRASSGVENALQANIATVFTNYSTTESILSMPMSSTAGDYPGTQNQLGFYFNPSPVGNGEYSLNKTAAGIYSDVSWKTSDARRALITSTGSGASQKFWVNKYKTGNPYTDWVPVIRYAEVLLNLAEARVRSSNTVDAQAIALLNAIRGRSDATTVFAAGDFASSADLADAVLRERRIEFLGEGLRNFDLMRLLQTIPAKSTAQAKTPADVGYIWPISASELSLNSLCTDN